MKLMEMIEDTMQSEQEEFDGKCAFKFKTIISIMKLQRKTAQLMTLLKRIKSFN